ncbi:MAG: T9SS type A sorting domain-containing protein, partial [Flavobacteriales bacterium]
RYYLKVRDNIAVHDVLVYNSVGQLVADFIMPGNQLAFDLNQTGVYVIRIRTSQGDWVRKFSASF